MLSNALAVTFFGFFIAIVVLGHVLLIAAIWPGLFGPPHDLRLDPAADPDDETDHPEDAVLRPKPATV